MIRLILIILVFLFCSHFSLASQPIGSQQEAVRLLQQATFGPNMTAIQELQDMGMEAWLDQQIALPPSFHTPLVTDNYRRDSAVRLESWWHTSIWGEDQLRQRMAFALSQILVVSQSASNLFDHQLGLINYYDLLVAHGLGNYRDLLGAVSKNAIMGRYLSYLGNQKANSTQRPDENYARELMQLFTIGMVELNMDGSPKLNNNGQPQATYQQQDVEQFAKVFTGWCFAAPANDRFCNSSFDFNAPMKSYDDYHDKSQKTLLNGTILAADQSAEQDLQAALDNLFHHDSIAPFISKQLIQKLVTSNPSPSYIERIAQIFVDNGEGVRGDLAAVAKAILLDTEARQGHLTAPTIFGKMRSPLLRMTHMWRALNADNLADYFRIYRLSNLTAQEPLNAPSVFNFYSADFTTATLEAAGLLAPEFQISNESQVIHFYNYLFFPIRYGISEHVVQGAGKTFQLYNQYQPYIDLMEGIEGDEGAIERLNLLFTGNTMSDDLKQSLRQLIIDIRVKDNARGIYDDYTAMANVMLLVMLSPEFVIQR